MANTCEHALKVIFNYDDGRTRIIYIDLVPQYNELLNSLHSYGTIENMYKYWIDDDNDKIEIKGDKSYKMFLKIAIKKRIFINYEGKQVSNLNRQTDSKSYVSLEDVELHEHVECNECKLFPILGLRYKCIVCPDFDLCMACTNKRVHSHHKMMRISSEQDYLFAIKEQELNTKQTSSIVNNVSLPDSLNLGKSWYDINNLSTVVNQTTATTVNQETSPLNNQNSITANEFSMLYNKTSLLNEQNRSILNKEYSMLDEHSKNNQNINNNNSMSNNKSLIEDKKNSNKNEIFINWNKMFSKISNVLGNILNIDTEINENSEILTTKHLTNSNNLPNIETASTSTHKINDNSTINDQNSYDPFTVVEILKNFNKMFSKISNALGNKVDIDNEINENHNVLNIENNKNKFEDQIKEVDVLFTFDSNIFLEILNNFNEMFSKIFTALEYNDASNIVEEIPATTIINGSNSENQKETIMETRNALTVEAIKKPTINYAQLSQCLYNVDVGAAQNLKNDEINKSVADIIALGYENEDGWIENLLASFDGDVVRAIDFLKPLNETFD